MKLLSSFLTAYLFVFEVSASIRVVHYNIKELDSVKLNKPAPQVDYAVKILKKLSPDILSINEIQFDIPGVPSKSYSSLGQNIKSLTDKIEMPLKSTSFFPANTGMNAKPSLIDETYDRRLDRKDFGKYADLVNFGLFPAQYSSAGAFNYRKINEVIVSGLKWKDFNPNINLSLYADSEGNPLPQDMELFDKSFSDITLSINGKPVHIILLHTVPAFGFGNKKTPNLVRNRDQLKFLEWYLTGESSYRSKDLSVKPLKDSDSFIAMGDWNVSRSAKKVGSDVIVNLGKRFKYWINKEVDTYVGQGLSGTTKNSQQLDYILLSKDIKIKQAGVYFPEANRVELGCGNSALVRPTLFDHVLIKYKKRGQECNATVSRDYFEVKKASDHLPIWVDIEFLNKH